MNHRMLLFFLGAIILPGAILGSSIFVESRSVPSDCSGRDAWMRASVSRFAAAEGAAGGTNRYSATTQQLLAVSNVYADAAQAQQASKPPGVEVNVSPLLAQVETAESDNWKAYSENAFFPPHTDVELATMQKNLADAIQGAEDHCA